MSDSDEEQTRQITSTKYQVVSDRPKYGKMVVLYDKNFLITLGPDYWCFLPTFIIFTLVSFFMIKFILTSSENLMLKISSVFICGGTCLAYLAVGISNPGIVTEDMMPKFQDEQSLMSNQKKPQYSRTCKTCNFKVKRKTYHCRICNVCVEGYDHHCPWTSKCIGKGNLIQFYLFVCMVPIFLVYVFVAFGVVMANNATHLHHHIDKPHF